MHSSLLTLGRFAACIAPSIYLFLLDIVFALTISLAVSRACHIIPFISEASAQILMSITTIAIFVVASRRIRPKCPWCHAHNSAMFAALFNLCSKCENHLATKPLFFYGHKMEIAVKNIRLASILFYMAYLLIIFPKTAEYILDCFKGDSGFMIAPFAYLSVALFYCINDFSIGLPGPGL